MKNNFSKPPVLYFSILFCVLLFAFLYFYRQTNNNHKKAEIAEVEWLVETFRRDKIKALEHSIKVIEKEKTQLETHFAKSSDVVPFLDTIEGLATKVGAKAEVTAVDILADRTGLEVGVKISGGFINLYKFLTLLENSSYELEFISVDLRKGVESWEAILKIKLL